MILCQLIMMIIQLIIEERGLVHIIPCMPSNIVLDKKVLNIVT